MVLDTLFVVISSIFIIVFLIPLYIYRKTIFKKYYKASGFELFLIDVKKFLHSEYPKIPFEFSIVNKLKDESDESRKEVLVVEDITKQFCIHDFTPTTQKPIPGELLWDNYQKNSKPTKNNKLPSDWSRRKDLTWKRDNYRCKRCGLKMKLDDAQICFVKPIEDGGTYHFENIFTACFDCNKILSTDDKSKQMKYLNIQDKLMMRVTD